MGWFEVLALLKRLAPMLSRIAPMLEAFMVTRGGTRADTEALDRLANDIKSELASASRSYNALTDLVSGQSTQVAALRDDLRHIREADERGASRLLEVEMQVAALGKSVRETRKLVIAVLVVCLIVLLALLVLLFHR